MATDGQVGLDGLVKTQLDMSLVALEKELQSDVMAYVGPIMFGVDEIVRRAVEAIQGRQRRLTVILDTPGGIVEVVERLVDTIRHHYSEVVFLIPDRAMSAGTVFALSGDVIYMNYFSVLGPIDPQVQKDGRLVPALAYLSQYERLKEKSESEPLTAAELVLLQKLDLGELQTFELARDLSVSLLKKWLVKYKFKDWRATEARGVPVTNDMREKRAEKIADCLMDHTRWHSHSRGISMAVLQSEDFKLKIDDYGKNETISQLVDAYFPVLRDYVNRSQLPVLVHTRGYF